MIMISSASESLTSTGTMGTSCSPAICDARQRRSPAMISYRSCTPRTGRTTIGWITPCSLIESASSPSSVSEKSRRGLRGLGFRNSIGTLRCARGRSRCAASPPTSPIRLARPRPSRERASSAIASSLGFNLQFSESDVCVLQSSFEARGVALAPQDDACDCCRHRKAPSLNSVILRCEPSSASLEGWRNSLSMRAQLALALDHFRRKLEIAFAADAFEIVYQHWLAVGRRLRDPHIARDHGVVDLAPHTPPDIVHDVVRQLTARAEPRQRAAM